jgi:hypothetical protein
MYSSNSFLPDSMLMGFANQSTEKAENHFNNQNYLECAIEVTRAESFLLYRDNSLSEQRGMRVIRACGLPPDEFYRFRSSLHPVSIRLGDGYVQIVRQTNFLIDRESAEFLLNYVKELISRIQGLE